MINRISSYVFLQLAVGLVMVTVAVTCVVWLSQSLRFIEMIVNRGLNAGAFLTLTGLMMPNFLTIILPIAIFIVTVFFYHKMIMDRELVVMRAAGMSSLSLSKPALAMAIALVGFGYALSIYIVPASYKMFREMQWDIRYNLSNVLLREGAFNEVAKGITIYVRNRTPDGQLLGILAHDSRIKGGEYTLMAESGAMIKTEEGARVVLSKGNRQSFDKKTNQLSLLYFDRYLFDMKSENKVGGVRFHEPRELTLSELNNMDLTNVRGAGKFTVEIHRRLALPWSAMGFVFIALASLMGGSFSRRGETKRVIMAIVLAGAYQAGILSAISAAAKQSALTPLIYVVTLTPIIVGLIALTLGTVKLRKRQQLTAGAV